MQTFVRRITWVALSAILALPATASACGWENIDHRVTYDDSGIWNTNAYRGMMAVSAQPPEKVKLAEMEV